MEGEPKCITCEIASKFTTVRRLQVDTVTYGKRAENPLTAMKV